MSIETNDLKGLAPCPFCGSSEDQLAVCHEQPETDWFVRCYSCGVETQRLHSAGAAKHAWNRRHSYAQQAVATLILGGIDGDELDCNDIEPHNAIIDAMQEKVIRTSEPIYLPLYTAAVTHAGASGITLTGQQIAELLDLAAPDRETDPDQLETEMTLTIGDETAHSGPGLYAYWTDYPEEGAVPLFDTVADDDGAADADESEGQTL